jgi:hypothetical protein
MVNKWLHANTASGYNKGLPTNSNQLETDMSKTIHQELEAARTFADTIALRKRINSELAGQERDGYLRSLDALEMILDADAAAAECEREAAWGREDLEREAYHYGF